MNPFLSRMLRLLPKAAATAVVAMLAVTAVGSQQNEATNSLQTCTSGQFEAKLTGWSLNNKMPLGKAEYRKSAKTLKVMVSAVALSDGTVLEIRNGDNKIGETLPLKDSETSAVIESFEIGDDLLVGIWQESRPIVTGSLKCVEARAEKK